QVREGHVGPARPAETSGGHGKDLLVRKAVMGIRLHLGLGGEGPYAGLPVAAHDPELQRDSWPALPAYEASNSMLKRYRLRGGGLSVVELPEIEERPRQRVAELDSDRQSQGPCRILPALAKPLFGRADPSEGEQGEPGIQYSLELCLLVESAGSFEHLVSDYQGPLRVPLLDGGIERGIEGPKIGGAKFRIELVYRSALRYLRPGQVKSGIRQLSAFSRLVFEPQHDGGLESIDGDLMCEQKCVCAPHPMNRLARLVESTKFIGLSACAQRGSNPDHRVWVLVGYPLPFGVGDLTLGELRRQRSRLPAKVRLPCVDGRQLIGDVAE